MDGAMAKRSARFPKRVRLRKRREFLAVQQGGKAHHGRYLVLVCAKGVGRVGITVSKRVGNAVVRNRVKRRFREILRTELVPRTRESECDLVLVAKAASASASFGDLRSELLGLRQRAA